MCRHLNVCVIYSSKKKTALFAPVLLVTHSLLCEDVLNLILRPYHVQQGLVVPQGSHHAHHGHGEHHQAQQDEHHSRSQEKPLQGSVLLPLHFGIHPHTQHAETHQLQKGDRGERVGKGKQNERCRAPPTAASLVWNITRRLFIMEVNTLSHSAGLKEQDIIWV